MTEEDKTILIEFKSMEDFKNRIAKLWQDQKDNEVYEFIFPDKETQMAWVMLAQNFGSDTLLDDEYNRPKPQKQYHMKVEITSRTKGKPVSYE